MSNDKMKLTSPPLRHEALKLNNTKSTVVRAGSEAQTRGKNRRNTGLFGAGIMSLIAACGSDGDSDSDNSGGGNGQLSEQPTLNSLAVTTVPAGKGNWYPPYDTDNTKSSVTLSFESGNTAILPVADFGGISTLIGPNNSGYVSKVNSKTAYTELHELTSNGVDLVVHSGFFDVDAKVDAGKVIILWDIGQYDDADSMPSITSKLEVIGAKEIDYIGSYVPLFPDIATATTKDSLDMVIAAQRVSYDPDGTPDDINTASENRNRELAGAIYVLWDVADYAATTKTIDLGSLAADATAGSLAIYGARSYDQIGVIAPESLNIAKSATEDSLDMVISSSEVNYDPDGIVDVTGEMDPNKKDRTGAGAIYVLWDVE